MSPKPTYRRLSTHRTITAAIMCACLGTHIGLMPTVQADEVILTSGEKFTSSKVWEENGKIRFNMHGLIVSVDPSDVADIIRADGAPSPTRSVQPQPQAPSAPVEPLPEQPIAATPPPQKIEPPPAPEPSTPQTASLPDTPAPLKSKRSGTGLSGIAWSMSPGQLTGLEKIKKEPVFGGIDQYWRPNEPMQLGNALLDGKVYGFWRNRLYSIVMWTEGRIGYERLRTEVFSRYGRGRKNAKGLERYVWLDDTTDHLLEFDDQLNTGFFWMRSRALDAQIKKLYPDA